MSLAAYSILWSDGSKEVCKTFFFGNKNASRLDTDCILWDDKWKTLIKLKKKKKSLSSQKNLCRSIRFFRIGHDF